MADADIEYIHMSNYCRKAVYINGLDTPRPRCSDNIIDSIVFQLVYDVIQSILLKALLPT